MEFTSLNNFFDHIYVITLERETERQENIVRCLEGLNYSFFFGIDKKALVMDDLIADGIYDEAKTIAFSRFGKPMNTGQIGSSWSHRLVYEDIIKNNYKNALILEDDISPSREGIEQFGNSMQELPANWDLIYFDCQKNLRRNFGAFMRQVGYHIRSFFGRVKLNHTEINNMFARKFSDNFLVAGMHDCSTAYAISKTAAKKLVKLQTPIHFLPEGLLSHVSTNKLVNAFVYKPKTFEKDMKLVAKTLID